MSRDKLVIPENLLEPFYIKGDPYLWTLTQGWALVGFYVRHETSLTISAMHGNHFANAHKHYGLLATEGGSDNTEWRYEGNVLIYTMQIIKVAKYYGQVPRTQV